MKRILIGLLVSICLISCKPQEEMNKVIDRTIQQTEAQIEEGEPKAEDVIIKVIDGAITDVHREFNKATSDITLTNNLYYNEASDTIVSETIMIFNGVNRRELALFLIDNGNVDEIIKSEYNLIKALADDLGYNGNIHNFIIIDDVVVRSVHNGILYDELLIEEG